MERVGAPTAVSGFFFGVVFLFFFPFLFNQLSLCHIPIFSRLESTSTILTLITLFERIIYLWGIFIRQPFLRLSDEAAIEIRDKFAF